MHRFVYRTHFGPIPSWCQIDHIDRDGLNNRKNNLRLSDRSLQQINSAKRLNTSSRFKGVHLLESGRWKATLYKNRVAYDLGIFDLEEEAALAYNAKALELYGSYASINVI
jgi:hypothetical protein